MDLVERTHASIQLLWLRLQLPHLLKSGPLDGLLMRLTARTVGATADFDSLERALDRAEALADRVPFLPRTCLYQCLARYAVFRYYGFPAEFVMGISPLGLDDDGHAWLEFGGEPYREARSEAFLVSFRYPVRAA